MGQPLKKLTIHGFKSIAALDDIELGNLNVLIGANGAGKSNFIDFFRMLHAMADMALVKFVNLQGGGDGFFYLGPQHTRSIFCHLEFGINVFEFKLEPTADGGLMIMEERAQFFKGVPTLEGPENNIPSQATGQGTRESITLTNGGKTIDEFIIKFMKANYSGTSETIIGPAQLIYESISNWTVYHFHDTSLTAPMRRDQSVRDWEYLRPDASNIAAYLLYLSNNNPQAYALIRDTIRQIAPFFDDFMLRPTQKGPAELVRLEWKQKGSDFPFQPYQLSDGTIRFICLATALLQPNPPSTIVIDEPELGLHPYALSLLAAMIQSASTRTQIIVSTQSPTLLDHFAPEDIIVVNRKEGTSTFERLSPDKLKEWLEEYTVGELWQKNVVEGGPAHE